MSEMTLTECILIKGFKQSLSHSVSVSLTPGYEVACQNISMVRAARPGWVTSNKVSGNSLPASVSSCCTTFPLFICIFHSFFHSCNEPVPFTSSKPPTIGCQLKNANKAASTSKRPRPSQALVKNADCHGGSQA